VSQQPEAHEVASQTQRPAVVSHSCPKAHALHTAPAVPQEASDWDAYASQDPAVVQQPFGHEAASHTHCPLCVLHS
jgi:hypothetical protein